jgi:hypothetical protein
VRIDIASSSLLRLLDLPVALLLINRKVLK